jgi:glycine cleavage system H protein
MADVRYSTSHEWCRLEDDLATCGITKHAIEQLGDLTFLDFRVAAGEDISKSDVFGEIDSVKATSELFAPMGGKIEEVNERFSDEDELPAMAESPEGDGWLVKIRVSDPAEFEALLDADAYAKHSAEA